MKKYFIVCLFLFFLVFAITNSKAKPDHGFEVPQTHAGIMRLVGTSTISDNWRHFCPLYTVQNTTYIKCVRDVFQRGGFIIRGKCTMLMPSHKWLDKNMKSCVYSDTFGNLFMYFTEPYNQLLQEMALASKFERSDFLRSIHRVYRLTDIETQLSSVKKIKTSTCQILVPYQAENVVYAVFGQKIVCAFYH